jgi:hypothetical protein
MAKQKQKTIEHEMEIKIPFRVRLATFIARLRMGHPCMSRFKIFWKYLPRVFKGQTVKVQRPALEERVSKADSNKLNKAIKTMMEKMRSRK